MVKIRKLVYPVLKTRYQRQVRSETLEPEQMGHVCTTDTSCIDDEWSPDEWNDDWSSVGWYEVGNKRTTLPQAHFHLEVWQ